MEFLCFSVSFDNCKLRKSFLEKTRVKLHSTKFFKGKIWTCFEIDYFEHFGIFKKQLLFITFSAFDKNNKH